MYKPTYHTLSKRGYITLLALLVSIITFAQGVTVKGTILDENKEPLIGATVQVKGETTGAAADLDGNFTLKAKKNATLVISYIGYLTQEVRLQGKTQVTIQLTPDSKTLDEVVVVGFGSQKKVNVTGAVSMVGSEVIESRPVQNVSQALQGVVPGLNFSVNTSGGALDNSLNVNIRGAGTDVIKIRGVSRLHKTDYSIIPDQIEAGTFMFAAAATRGDVTVMNVIPKHLEATIAKLVEIGCEVEEFDDAVRVVSKGDLHNTQVKTLPYPGFPTDMQPQIAVTLALAEGTSIVTESIFENRFKYVDELTRMGANIKVESNIAIINGVTRYTGARVNAPDLRAGAALVIAGLVAEGITVIDDIYFIERGYEEFDQKLRGIGAQIEKVSDEKEIQKFKLRIG